MQTFLLKTGRQIIGRAGEMNETAVAVNIAKWVEDYPAGIPQLMVTTPGGQRIPLVVTVEDGLMVAVLPDTVTVGPGLYVYTAVMTNGGTQVLTERYECIILGSELAQTWKPLGPRVPDWAERIFVAADVIERAMDGAIEARTTAVDKAAEAQASAEAAAASEGAAELSAQSAAARAQEASDILDDVIDQGAAQVTAIQAEGAAVMEEIPTAYTALSHDVDRLDTLARELAKDGTYQVPLSGFEAGSYNGSGGKTSTANHYRSTELMAVEPGTVRITTFNRCRVFLCFYDAGGQWLGKSTTYGAATVDGTYVNDVDMLELQPTARFFRLVYAHDTQAEPTADMDFTIERVRTLALLEDIISRQPRHLYVPMNDRRMVKAGLTKNGRTPYTTGAEGCFYPNILFPLAEGETLTANPTPVEGVTYQYTWGYYGQDGSYVDHSGGWNENAQTVTGQAGAVYVMLCVRAIDTQAQQQRASFEREVEGIDFVYGAETDAWLQGTDVDGKVDSADIVALNRHVYPLLASASKPLNNAGNGGWGFTGNPRPLILLHFSDLHGDGAELKRLIRFRDQFENRPGYIYKDTRVKYIDDTICTGDMVYNSTDDDFTYWAATPGTESILLAVGNHDAFVDENTRMTQAEMYAAYIEPFKDGWGVTIGAGNTYYFKDYADRGVRLIVLNEMLGAWTPSADHTAQLSWFTTTLEGARTAGLAVIVAKHGPIANCEKVNCNWTRTDKISGDGFLASEAYVSAVETFKNNGGKFICWFGGHTHSDFVLRHTETGQLCVIVDAATREQCNQYSDIMRMDGTQTMDMANLMAIDTTTHTLRIIRVGANHNCYLVPRNTLTIDYESGEIVAQT